MLLVSAYLALFTPHQGEFEYDLEDWNSFKNEHNKTYDNKEVETLRRSIFAYNKHLIDRFNENQAERLGFSLEVNHLADVGNLEIRQRNGFRLPVQHKPGMLFANDFKADKFLENILNNNSIEVPDEVDWRKVPGRVTRVKNQGNCGSCWAFASTGALEGQEKVQTNFRNNTSYRYRFSSFDSYPGRFISHTRRNTALDDTVELSEQNLVDCVKDDAGCNGGFMKDALEFVHVEGGIDDEKSYPYEAREKKCRFRKDKVAFSDSGAAILPTGDEQKLKEVVAKFGPVAVAIDASSIWFQLYKKGVYYNKRCKNKEDQLDHAVLVVGYGTDPKKGDYWIVKNSWGPKYGEDGYIRMSRNRNNNCGIATVATIPTF